MVRLCLREPKVQMCGIYCPCLSDLYEIGIVTVLCSHSKQSISISLVCMFDN